MTDAKALNLSEFQFLNKSSSDSLNFSGKDLDDSLQSEFGGDSSQFNGSSYSLFKDAHVYPPPKNYYTVRERMTHLEHWRYQSEPKNQFNAPGISGISSSKEISSVKNVTSSPENLILNKNSMDTSNLLKLDAFNASSFLQKNNRTKNFESKTIPFDYPPVELVFKNIIDEKEIYLDNNDESIFSTAKFSLLDRFPIIIIIFEIIVDFIRFIISIFVKLWSFLQWIAEYVKPLQFIVGCLPYKYLQEEITNQSPFVFALDRKNLRLACSVSNGSNQIRLFDLKSRQYERFDLNSFHHKSGVRKIVWSPGNSDKLLAVCKNGICVWDIATRIGQHAGKCIFLPLKDATSASFFIDASDGALGIIGVTSTSDRLYQWRFDKGWYLYQKKSILSGPLEKISISPSSTFISVQPFRDGKLIFYDNQLKKKITWIAADRIQTSAWSPNERFFFFATKNDNLIHILEFHQVVPSLRMSYHFALDFSTYEDENTGEKLCGNISLIRIHKNRMAVAFKDSDLIAILSCNLDVLYLQYYLFMPVGFIRPYKKIIDPTIENGLNLNLSDINNEKKTQEDFKLIDMQFFENFPSGSLLTTLHGGKKPLLSMYKLES